MILEPTVASPAVARAYCDDVLMHAGHDANDEVRLVVSELVTNSVLHAGTPIDLAVTVDGNAIHIEVTDFGGDVPRAWVRETAGRGLPIVRALVHDWGVVEQGLAKTVWCDLMI